MEFTSIFTREDENILTKTKITIIIAFIVICLLLNSGCINNNSNNHKEQNLDITIKNNENFNTSIILIVINSENEEIFNQTINVSPNEYLTYYDLTNKKGIYTVRINQNNIIYENKEIQVGNEYSTVKIHISKDYVKISQLVK